LREYCNKVSQIAMLSVVHKREHKASVQNKSDLDRRPDELMSSRFLPSCDTRSKAFLMNETDLIVSTGSERTYLRRPSSEERCLDPLLISFEMPKLQYHCKQT
jgi:hypothetical protein